MRKILSGLALGLLLGTASAQASRLPRQYQAPQEISAEQAAIRARSHSGMSQYGQGVSAQTKPIPWFAIGLAVAALLVALPFMRRAFVQTASEMAPGDPKAR